MNAYWTSRGVPHASNQARRATRPNDFPLRLCPRYARLREQFQFSLLSTLPLETGLFEACSELGVTPIGRPPRQPLLPSASLQGSLQACLVCRLLAASPWAAQREVRRKSSACRPSGSSFSPDRAGALSSAWHAQGNSEGKRCAPSPVRRRLLRDARSHASQVRGTSMSTVAINWCMCQGALVIVGVKTPEQARFKSSPPSTQTPAIVARWQRHFPFHQ